MSEKKRVVSEDMALKARALFTMAADHYRKAAEFEAALGELLGCGDDHGYCGWFSDEMCNDGNFDKAMKLEGFTVKAKRQRKP
jgi:hypothetical protein